MSEPKKKKFNPWVTIVLLGVGVILFAVFALQQQSDLMDAGDEIDRLKQELVLSQRQAEMNAAEAEKQKVLALLAVKELEDCRKTPRKR